MNEIRVVVVDDEPVARAGVQKLLRSDPDFEIVGEAGNGRDAVALIQRVEPDLVLLDIQMPELNGFDVLSAIGTQNAPVIVFITAYDQFALKAFDVAALDYLVKPFDDERFEQAFERARRLVELRDVGRVSAQLLKLLQSVDQGTAAAAPGHAYLERIAVEMRGQVRVVPVSDIDYITASGQYAELHVGEKTHVIRERMQTLEERLDPAKFFRIHRSAIVRLDRIDTLLRDAGGDYAVRLKGGAQLSVSRGRIEALESWMGVKKADDQRG
jgi:two-component system LytT family response regulator